ncbi:SRPBCC family protein [Pseudomonadota bacterium]|jgi:carbon monoxide dehydrogenase subunit G
MQVDLEKEFELPGSAAQGWEFLQNIPGVASCMPGAEITDTIDENNYKGKVKMKIGPAAMAFAGDIVISNIDAQKRELNLLGKGQDSKGSSSASMDLTAWIVDTDGGKSALKGNASVTVTGKAASLGGRMMMQVADQILNQFGANFADHIAAMGGGAEAEEAREHIAHQPKEINGLRFAWSVFIGWLRSLFSGK